MQAPSMDRLDNPQQPQHVEQSQISVFCYFRSPLDTPHSPEHSSALILQPEPRR